MDIGESAEVLVPTVPALLADKLTAFAPNTIGVQYVNSRGDEGDLMQIGKQLFDVGELFDLCPDLHSCHDPYHASFAVENGYRDGKFTLEEVLEDSLQAALHSSFRHPKRPEHHDRIIQRCVRPMQGHLAGCSFGTPEATIAAGKVAVLIEILKLGKGSETLSPALLKPPGDLSSLRGVSIQGEWAFLKNIQGTSAVGFHYWHQASLVRNGTR